jgi:hypothetical protein
LVNAFFAAVKDCRGREVVQRIVRVEAYPADHGDEESAGKPGGGGLNVRR